MCCETLVKLLYDVEQLEYLCIFDVEQKRLCNTWITKRILFRLFFASLLLPLIPMWHYLYHFNTFFPYLTNWGLVLTLSSLLVTAYMPYSKTYRKKKKLMAWNHALLSMAIISETLVTCVYWTVMH